jgi:hypothetical protein
LETLKATVTSIGGGRSGRFAIAASDAMDGSITFSLHPPVWAEEQVPEPGDKVFLSDLKQKRAGWRAMSGRWPTPEESQ